jgi:hypothetical protein
MRRLAAIAVATLTVAPLLLSCGEKETPEQRLARLRSRHEIIPAGITNITQPDGTPALLVDVQIVNQGTEPLDQLTVAVEVQGADGTEKAKQRVTFDLSDMRPGIGERRSAVLPGLVLADDDEVTVELEANLSPDELRRLPEWSSVAGTGAS